jgi:hypothetical protein
MSVVLMSIASMQTSQSRENRALMEKLASAELARVLVATLERPTACNMMFTKAGNVLNPGNLNFTGSGNFPFSISLKAIPFDATTNAASVSAPVNTLSQTLRIKPDGITVKVTSATSGQLQIKFDQSKLIRPIADLSLPITLATTVSGSTKKITGCVGEGSISTALDTPCSVSTQPVNPFVTGPFIHVPQPGFVATLPCRGALVTDGKVPAGTRCAGYSYEEFSVQNYDLVFICLAGKWVQTNQGLAVPF